MASNLLGVAGIILTFVGIGLTLLAVGWTAHSQGQALANPNQQGNIGRRLQSVSWVWFVAGWVFVGIALYLVSELLA